MTDFSSAPARPSTNLRRVLREGSAKASIDRLESNLVANVEDIKRKVRGREKLTSGEIQALNEYNKRQISAAFDEAKESVIEQTEIKPSDDSDEQSAKVGIVDEVTDFIQNLAVFIIEKIRAIISAFWNAVAAIGQKIKSFFTGLWSWMTRDE